MLPGASSPDIDAIDPQSALFNGTLEGLQVCFREYRAGLKFYGLVALIPSGFESSLT